MEFRIREVRLETEEFVVSEKYVVEPRVRELLTMRDFLNEFPRGFLAPYRILSSLSHAYENYRDISTTIQMGEQFYDRLAAAKSKVAKLEGLIGGGLVSILLFDALAFLALLNDISYKPLANIVYATNGIDALWYIYTSLRK